MDWIGTEQLLIKMTETYTQDNLRKMTFNKEIFPLWMRFRTGERSSELYVQIRRIDRCLMKEIYREHAP